MMDDVISRQVVVDTVHKTILGFFSDEDDVMTDTEKTLLNVNKAVCNELAKLPSVHPEVSDTYVGDIISRQDAIDALEKVAELYPWRVPGDRDSYSKYNEAWNDALDRAESEIEALPSAQPEQRYTEEELRVFQHGISLSMLSKRSAQHWQYDEDMATKIKFLERLYEKVGADMRGEQDG